MLNPLPLEDLHVIQARGLGLGRASTPWDFIAEAWRSALWALCHPHWQPASTQRLSNLFLDLAGPVLGPGGFGEAELVRNHLVAVGDLIRLPGGEWLPAPLKLITSDGAGDPQVIGGMPSWVLPEVHLHWLGSPGFRRTSHEGIGLHHVALAEWCNRGALEEAVPDLTGVLALVEALPAKPWEPTQDVDIQNRALAHPSSPPDGAWVLVRDRLTHHVFGIGVRGRGRWFLRTLPAWMDGRMAHLVCKAKSWFHEGWQVRETARETVVRLFVQLPDWHWQVLLCGCLRPLTQDPIHHDWLAVIAPTWLEPLQTLVFSPLQMVAS